MPATLDSLDAKLDLILARLEEQVAEGPVVVIPPPAAGQTTAYTYCYNEHGVAEKDVAVEVKLVDPGTAAKSAWDTQLLSGLSAADGLVTFSIPRQAGLRFAVRRARGPWVEFLGVDSQTLEMPAVIGK